MIVRDGQTVFFLNTKPSGSTQMFVNGYAQSPGKDFIVGGTEVSWISNDFPLGSSDELQFVYTV